VIFRLIKKYKTQLGDSLWSIMGLVLMNAVMQIAAYPMLAKIFGESGYGDIQYLMAYVNIITVSVGCAANLARMTAPAAERLLSNGDYNLFLLGVALLGVPFTLLVSRFGGVEMDASTTVCYYLLFVGMAFRYYADVSYKLTLRYRRYFVYYLLIGIGYGVGALLVWKTEIWPLALLPGELLGVLYAYVGDGTLRRGGLRPSKRFGWVAKCILILFLSEGISNLIFNVDRLILKLLIGSSAVTVYYLATLVGKTASLVSTPLNGVLIGYLARYDGRLSKRIMKWVMLGSLVCFVLFTAVCTLGGYVALWLLYPAELATAKEFLLLGSLAQVIFFTTSFVTVILIRFASKAYQVIINGVFGVCFFGIGIPATILGRLWGFAVAMVVVNGIRWLTAIVLGWYKAIREERVPTTN
jgi:O-antigen/teichoic acid export membrane protein